jgi:hypothetical protein
MTLGGKVQPNNSAQSPNRDYHQQRSSKWIEKQALKDNINSSQRGGEIIAVTVIGFIALFFYAHQTESTGFFTSSFGPTEALLLYGAILTGVAGPISKFLTGKRNTSRPPEMIASVFWVIASAWFLMVVFPFNFAHFADVVPDFLAFLVSWITNDIARVLLAIGMVGGIVSIGINSVLYIKVKAFLLRQQSDSITGMVH